MNRFEYQNILFFSYSYSNGMKLGMVSFGISKATHALNSPQTLRISFLLALILKTRLWCTINDCVRVLCVFHEM